MTRTAPARTLAAVTLAVAAALAASCAGVVGQDVVVTPARPSSTTTSTGAPPARSAATTPASTADPRTVTGSGNAVTLVFGGDVHEDGPLATLLAADPSQMLRAVQPVLGGADLSIVNLETAVGTGGVQAQKQFTFLAPPTTFTSLRDAGVGVIGMANNHAVDFGQAGLAQTLAAITAAGAPVIGIGKDEADAYKPFTQTINGQRVSVIAATQIIDDALVSSWTATSTHPGVASAKREDRLLAAVRAARAASDTVVVFLHWGTEKTYCPNAAQLALTPKLIAAGADIIVGTHAHRVQGGGFSGAAYVEYGLGNLQFKVGSDDARELGLLRITVTGRRVDKAEWIPARIGADYLPSLLSGGAAAAATARWDSRRGCAKLSATPGGPVATGAPVLGVGAAPTTSASSTRTGAPTTTTTTTRTTTTG